jgi:hypothetical protein
VSEDDSVECETRLYELLFLEANPSGLDDFRTGLNPKSLTVHKNSRMLKSLLNCKKEDKF